MYLFSRIRRKCLSFKCFSAVISVFLSLSLIFQHAAAYAQYIPGLNLPAPGAMVNPSPAFVPVLIKGLAIDPQNPFQFEFIVDSGNSRLTTDEIKKEYES